MTNPPDDGRIEARVPKPTKQKYEQHALTKYGMKLATWVKMLMHKDFSKKNHD